MKKVFLLLIGLVFLFGCAQSGFQETGTLEGHITIGPLCPVVQFPSEENCQPTEETYLAHTLTLYKVGTGDPGPLIKVTEFNGDKDGNYKLELEPGTYQIIGKTGISSLYKTVQIKARETVNLDIDIDTGIR